MSEVARRRSGRETGARRAVALGAVACLLLAACSGAKKDEGSASVEAGDTATTVAAGGDAVTPVDPNAPASAGPTAPGATPAQGGGTTGTVGGNASPTGGGTKAASGGATSGGVAAAPKGAGLFSGALDTRGITKDSIVFCGHAALTFGPAFNATPEDLGVYFQAINDDGGVFGRKIKITFENDDYDPAKAVQAATACKNKNPFAIFGGIGFDQIPAVRNWAEANKELYLYHIATERGAEGKKYSFTTQASVEQVGRAFGELIVSKHRDKKIGVLYRDSEFWAPGYEAFKVIAAQHKLNVTALAVQKNQGNYTQQLVALKNAGVQVVWAWENTLALTQMVKQAKAQNYSPQWVAFPFNLTSQTLGDDAMSPKMEGLATWPGYSKGDYSGAFAEYADDMKLFEQHYRKYRPNTDIGGVAGDLLWLAWVEQKRLVEMLRACGPDCTRDRFAGLLVHGYKAEVSPTCPLDFSGGRRNGSGGWITSMETYRSPSGKVNWRTVNRCRQRFL